MACQYCGQEVKLTPTAKARAREFGETPEHYLRLFPDHAKCVVEHRSQMSRDVVNRIRESRT